MTLYQDIQVLSQHTCARDWLDNLRAMYEDVRSLADVQVLDVLDALEEALDETENAQLIRLPELGARIVQSHVRRFMKGVACS
jgi:hypothetical protein